MRVASASARSCVTIRDGHSQIAIEVANQIHDFRPGMAIEISRWLVGEKKLAGEIDESTG